MFEQEFIMLIMNCKKYHKKALFQRMTWLPKIPTYLKYYHVIGDPNLEVEYKFIHDSQILWIKVDDDYNSLPKKVIRAYKAINETFDYKYIFKTDDDQILVNDNFFDILKGILMSKQPKIHYGGYIIDVKQNYLSEYNKIHPELPDKLPVLKTKYCSGRFYFLSKQSTQNLLYKCEYIERAYLEDHAIGYYLDQCYKENMLSLLTNRIFTDIELSDFPKLVEMGKI